MEKEIKKIKFIKVKEEDRSVISLSEEELSTLHKASKILAEVQSRLDSTPEMVYFDKNSCECLVEVAEDSVFLESYLIIEENMTEEDIADQL